MNASFPIFLVAMVQAFACDAVEQSPASPCFSATTRGSANVEKCVPGDPLNLAKDRRMLAAMSALNIEANEIVFRGCKGVAFSTTLELESPDTEARYIVQYPVRELDAQERQKLLAPVAHELGHVVQLKNAGNKDLRRTYGESLLIELEADYLTGIAFANQKLKDEDINAFQHNLDLIGLYREADINAHGSPIERGAAFRHGLFHKFSEEIPDVAASMIYFQGDLYESVIKARGRDRSD